MKIRAAGASEFVPVRAFYHSVIDGMAGAEYSPGWKKGIYPSDEDLQTALDGGTLFVGEEDGKLCAAMVVNHDNNDSYAKVAWPTDAKPEEVTVIHMLCVHPSRAGRGYAKLLVDYALDMARSGAQKCVRLDVLRGNIPANRLYEGKGFRYIDTVTMFYEDVCCKGWFSYHLIQHDCGSLVVDEVQLWERSKFKHFHNCKQTAEKGARFEINLRRNGRYIPARGRFPYSQPCVA